MIRQIHRNSVYDSSNSPIVYTTMATRTEERFCHDFQEKHTVTIMEDGVGSCFSFLLLFYEVVLPILIGVGCRRNHVLAVHSGFRSVGRRCSHLAYRRGELRNSLHPPAISHNLLLMMFGPALLSLVRSRLVTRCDCAILNTRFRSRLCMAGRVPVS